VKTPTILSIIPIFQVADTFAWVLMPNHFHFLVRINNKANIKTTPSLQFSKLFNAYAQAFNKQEERHGALFERPFKRKLVEDEDYLRDLILYIHNNPVHHGFCEKPEDYLWSSYHSYLSEEPAKLQRKLVISLFDDIANFKYVHNKMAGIVKIDEWD